MESHVNSRSGNSFENYTKFLLWFDVVGNIGVWKSKEAATISASGWKQADGNFISSGQLSMLSGGIYCLE